LGIRIWLVIHKTHSLKAILFADAAGYSRMMHDDQQATLAHIRACLKLFYEFAPRHDGVVVKTMGDGTMLEFDSAVSALECAADIQHALGKKNAGLPNNRQLRFRMGIHLGEVQSDGEDRLGHIVNVAARVERLANPGRICITKAVHDQTRRLLAFKYRNLGPKYLKNIPEAVILFEVDPDANSAVKSPPEITTAEISILDEVAVHTNAGEILIAKAAHIQALIGYLALCDDFSATRSAVQRLLWSEASLAEAQKALRSLLRQLKRLLARAGKDIFLSDNSRLAFDMELVKVDLIAIANSIEAGELDRRLLEKTPITQRVMPGLENVDRAFAAWLGVTRHNWLTRLLSLLENTIERFAHDRNIMRQLAMALLNLDETHEYACRILMESYVTEGNTPAALRLYNHFAKKIRNEFGIEPAEAIEQLASSIRAGKPLTPAFGEKSQSQAAGTMHTPQRLPSIVVRPINVDNGGIMQHLYQSFQAELIAALMRFRDWVVVEPASAGSGKEADYLLEAYCVADEAELMLAVTFMEAGNKRYIWSETYPMSIGSWLKAQRDIVRKIAASLNIHLTISRIAGGQPTAGMSLDSYDKWLRGEHLLNRWRPEFFEQAEHLFRRVIDEMPDFAPAYCSLASALNIQHLVFPGVERSLERVEIALELARRAVEIDPLETRAHLTLAWSNAMAGKFDQADLHYELACQLNPNNPRTLISCAQGYAFTDRIEMAIEMETAALDLSPTIPDFLWAYLAVVRFVCGRYEESLNAANRAGNAIVDMPGWRAISLVNLGRKAEAAKAGQELLGEVRRHWAGSDKYSDEAAVRWFLDSFPLRSAQTRERLRQGLAHAGLPVG
jgi:class 3 adenylate cyclase/DNA-binding SARP family transcriptional activator